jgi:hypothetical protein
MTYKSTLKIVLTLVFSLPLMAQTPHMSIGGHKVKHSLPPATVHERFATFMTDGDFRSQLLVQNLRLDLPITIAPALIINQSEIALEQVTIPAHSSTTIDINAALKAHGQSDTQGIVVVRYQFYTYGAISAVVEMSDYTHRLYLNSIAQSAEEFWYGTSFDAVIWALDQQTEGFMSVVNTSTEAKNVQVTFSARGAVEDTQTFQVAPYQYRELKIDSLIKDSIESGGSIHVDFSGKPGDIVAEGTLLNKKTGFSKNIRFVDKELRYSNASLRTNLLLLGIQPTVDGYPLSLGFRAVSAVLNTDSAPVHVTPLIKFLRDGNVQKINLSPLTLGPNESRIIDFAREQNAGNIPSDFRQGSLELVPDGTNSSVIAELFNFSDKSGGYVIGPSFTAHPSRATTSIWRTDGSFQTTIMIENTATQDDQITATLFSEAGSYEKAFPIAAGGLLKINIRDLQQSAVPDKNGHFLVGMSGTLSISGAHGHSSALAFDKTIHSADEADYVGHVGSPCDFVAGIFTFLTGSANPFILWLEEDWTDGSAIDYEGWPATSSNSTFVSVDTSGNVTFHPDSSSHSVNLTSQDTTETCDECTTGTLEATEPVTDPALSITSISPAQGMVGTAVSVTINGVGFVSGTSVNAGSNIAVSSVSIVSSTQITATFTPTNSSSAGGNQAVTVTANGITSASKNFFVQVPTHFVRFDFPPAAPGGIGPVVTITNGSVVNLAGIVSATGQCGVYRNFVFELVDQQTTPVPITAGTAVITEVFSNIVGGTGPTPSVNTLNLATQGENDVQSLSHTAPSCLATNENESLDMTWTVGVGSTTYPLATVVHITKGNFSGTLNVTSTITTP